MSIGKKIGSLIRVAVVAALAYGIWTWQDNASQDGDTIAFARKACLDEIRGRYNVSSARVYDVEKNNNGYVVHATVTLPRGHAAKVLCLANPNGGVRDITIDER